jgi:hypothetical protein
MASMGLGSAAAVLLPTTGTDSGTGARGYVIIFGLVASLNMQSVASSAASFGPCSTRYVLAEMTNTCTS